MIGEGYVASAFSDFLFRSTAGNLLASLVFGLALFLAATWLLRARNVRRIRTRLEPHLPARADEETETGLRERLAFLSGLFEATERAFGKLQVWRKLAMALERADSPLRPAEFFYVMLGLGLVLASFLALLGAPVALMLLAFLLGAVPPIVVLTVKAGRRQQAFDDQLPDLLMTMAGSLRIGHTFRLAMQAVVDEGEEPASKEFKRVLLEIGIGRPVEEALEDMAARMRSKNFEYVISVVSVQREVGGSLGGLFDMVSQTVRQRQQFTKKVSSLTAMSRWSAYILCAMPFFMAAVISVMRPGYLTPLFTTPGGRVLIAIALGGIALGGLVLNRIVSYRMA
jgi:tight adherence protein B